MANIRSLNQTSYPHNTHDQDSARAQPASEPPIMLSPVKEKGEPE
jgi:hypothetical protein